MEEPLKSTARRAAERKEGTDMEKKRTLPVALQLYSVRGDIDQDFEGTLRAVKDMGYDGVELVGLYGRKPEDVRKAAEAVGLAVVSAHVPYAEMTADPDGVMQAYAAAGCSYIAVPYLEEAYRPGHDRFFEMIDKVAVLGEAAKRAGLTLLYHNHDFEFQKVEGQYGLDLLYERVSPSLLQTELDTCWVNVAGEDPAAYLAKYAGRAPVVHLKDFVLKGRKPAHMYDLIGLESEKTPADNEGSFAFRPLGHGMQNIPSILEAGKRAGAKWFVVEQDEPSLGLSPLECARTSLETLDAIDW